MSEPHIIKQGDTSPAFAVTLTDSAGVPVSITGQVLFTMRLAADPYTDKITSASAVVANQMTSPGQVQYNWTNADTDTPGEYLAEWYVADLDQTFPTGDYNRVTVVPSLTGGSPPSPPLVSVGDVETAIGRSMTPAETARALQLIAQVESLLARVLNRDLKPARYTETHLIPATRRILPYHGPFRSMVTVQVEDGDAVTDYNSTWDRQEWVPGTKVTIDYWAGDDGLDPAVQGVVIDAVARAIVAGPSAATGAIRNYSVEGTSITYGTNVAGGENAQSAGRIPVADLTALSRLKRRVLRP
jgi:hypothetical protein